MSPIFFSIFIAMEVNQSERQKNGELSKQNLQRLLAFI